MHFEYKLNTLVLFSELKQEKNCSSTQQIITLNTFSLETIFTSYHPPLWLNSFDEDGWSNFCLSVVYFLFNVFVSIFLIIFGDSVIQNSSELSCLMPEYRTNLYLCLEQDKRVKTIPRVTDFDGARVHKRGLEGLKVSNP